MKFGNPQSIARHLADELERAGIDYAIGGALAYGYWAEPRGTIDVDLTAFVSEDKFETLFHTLAAAGCEGNWRDFKNKLLERGIAPLRFEGYRVDVYVPDIPLYRSARARRKQVPFENRPAWVWSAEDLCLFKLLYFRGKDKVDIEEIVLTQAGKFDRGYVSRQLEEMVGNEDERMKWWRELIAREEG